MIKKTIAVVGVSNNPNKYGYRIFVDLLKNGFDVFGVNPKGGKVLDKDLYSNLKDIPKKIDLVITVVPPKITEDIIEQCRDIGIKEVWMQPGSESEEAIKKAKEYGINVTFRACFMVMNEIW